MMPPRRASAAGLVFALLVLATVAAFAWSQRLKRAPLVLDNVSFTAVRAPLRPASGCPRERIRFRVTRSDQATIEVLGPDGRLVRTLARDRYLAAYHFFSFYWDGEGRRGEIVPPGHYRVRVELLGQERNLLLSETIRLHRVQARPRRCTRAARGGR